MFFVTLSFFLLDLQDERLVSKGIRRLLSSFLNETSYFHCYSSTERHFEFLTDSFSLLSSIRFAYKFLMKNLSSIIWFVSNLPDQRANSNLSCYYTPTRASQGRNHPKPRNITNCGFNWSIKMKWMKHPVYGGKLTIPLFPALWWLLNWSQTCLFVALKVHCFETIFTFIPLLKWPPKADTLSGTKFNVL